MKTIFLHIKNDLALLILRISVGLSMLFAHGLPKLKKLTEGTEEIKFYDFAGMGAEASLTLAVFSELICSALLAIGLFSRLSIIPLWFTMFVAFFMVHAADPFAKKEMAFLYFIVYSVLLISGPGKFSLDGIIAKRITSKTK